MRTRTGVLIVVALLLVAAAAIGGLKLRAVQRSPLYSLKKLALAIQVGDRLAVEHYLDVPRVSESIVDDAISVAGRESMTGANSDGAWGSLGSAIGMRLVDGMKGTLVSMLTQHFWDGIERRGNQDPSSESRVHDLVGGELDLTALQQRYRGITDVQELEDRARVGIRLADSSDSMVVHLRMERTENHWRVIGVEGLASQLARTSTRASNDGGVRYTSDTERAYAASMKSDLRNLVTAEEAYFADSVRYTSNLGSWFSTTSGVVGPTIRVTADGWTAWVSHTQTPLTCAIYVGSTARSPATKEGEPRCSR